MSIDDVIVLAMVLLAAGYMGRRLWRRLRPAAPGASGGCGSCGSCGGVATNRRSCSEVPLVRRD